MKRFVYGILAVLLAWSMSGAHAAELLLGAGDVVKVSVFGNTDLAVETRVSESGYITFPLIGQVAVAGLSSAEAEKKIATALESGGFVKKPQVNLLVTLLTSQQVSVLGQVNRPGRYPVDGRRTMLDMLALAGGIAPDGGDVLTVIRKRDGKIGKNTVDIVELFRKGDMLEDYDLAGGDVLFVERAPRFYIYGEVQRPGPVRLERNTTVLQALSAGGGLTQRGTERGIRIKRRDSAGKMQILDAKPDDLVQVDDVVYVKESIF
ncbi:polysaccharide export protein EpsE [Pseudoduganella sp. FT25W]|jgi:polysaccharide export outer membrane protein|uniref:Polysaccharide export protein EpsE n=1 Tax=Duganella alba TaxID=2666081 RepID=A0A6L5QNP2_9BURK|nr:polysaccharide export protein EpsE [Duganella alba]MRX10978.1 polysaccharide export protein EpsE [Duganella alba]MRX19163.1 polysaccharide export protein EpsE [Duganella alba]